MKQTLIFAVIGFTCFTAAEGADRVSFNRDIRPILSDACFQCHGPDDKQRKSGLRLDLPDSGRKPAESGAIAIVPGHPETSELVQRLVSTDENLSMPPRKSGKKLTAAQMELLKRWIAEGAEYQGHWAFIPPEIPTVPAVNDPRHEIVNPIDAFVRSRLGPAGLTPAPAADKSTLIRRVSLDLTGLPPTPAEVEAFLQDHSPHAYETVVDRLLQSPRYGERMAQQWLDFARYADSNGFQIDSSRYQWPWRDWVINAYNNNLPFDQFTIEQLAGDLLPNPTRSQIVATGFNRNHRLNGEGGLIAEEWRVETVIDRVETTGMTWLGLTFNCCRCHDHKYDPITQREFYQFFAFFNNVAESGTLQGESQNTEPVVTAPTAEQELAIAALDEKIQAAEIRVTSESGKLAEFMAKWEPEFKAKLSNKNETVWNPLSPTRVASERGATLTKLADGSYLASGENPNHDVYTITAPLPVGSFSGLLLECLPDTSLPNQSLGRYSNGNFVLSGVEAEIRAPSLAESRAARFAKAEATYSQSGWGIGLVLDNVAGNGWAVDGPTRRDPTSAMFLFDGPITVPEQATVTVRLKQEALGMHNIGRFRVSFTSLPPGTVTLDGAKFPESLKAILDLAADKRSAAEKVELETFFKANVDSPFRQAESAVARLKKQRLDLVASVPNVMVMKEAGPREAFILTRGEYDKRGEPVTASLPSIFSAPVNATPVNPAPIQPRPLNRLDLAKWIVNPSNPLTARVWVNRVWEKFFGIGLVKTSENLGSQSEFPSHPELLDWLALEFSQGQAPWDMKALQKQILMSATYRQSSRYDALSISVDPENRFLSHGPRFRLPAEVLRDQALFVSGLLVEKRGGPSVRPYMPEGVWDETSRYGDLRNYKHDRNDGLYRRSLYTVWKRTAAPPAQLKLQPDAAQKLVLTGESRANPTLDVVELAAYTLSANVLLNLDEVVTRE